MKLPRSGLRSLLMLSLVIASSPSAGGASGPEAERPGQRLLRKLKLIADSGRLHDRAFVERILEMKFEGPTREMVDQPPKCEADSVARSSIMSTLRPAEGSGLRPSADGVASVPVYSPFQSEPTLRSGPTQLAYDVARNRYCTGNYSRIEETDARLKISRVQAFACISSEELEAWLPKAKQDMDHHAEKVAYYRGREFPDRRAEISFRFSYSRCVESIDVHQSPEGGLRYRAAQQRHESCLLPHQAQYCRTHAPFGWGDGGRQNEMDQFAFARCGSFEQFYRSTPRNARPDDRTLPDGDESTPCAAVLSDLAASKKR